MLDAARDELDRALEELRELARGIHPAVLTDRGLEAALEALAGRTPLPVSLDQMPAERLPAPVEAAAYFVVAEALTNVAKYADGRAGRRCVSRRNNGYAVVEVARRRRRRRRSGHRLRPARARRPGRRARRPPRGRLAPRGGHDGESGDPVRVVLADDSVLLREGLARAAARSAGFEVVAQAGDAEDLLRKVGAHKPDVAIVDVRMPPTHTDEGLRAAAEIRERVPGHRRARALAVRRGGLRAGAAELQRRGRRLPAQGPRRRRRTLHRRGAARGGGRQRARPRGRRRGCSAAAAARTRWRDLRRASARCSG